VKALELTINIPLNAKDCHSKIRDFLEGEKLK